MERSYPASQLPNHVEVLRKAGYSYFVDPQSHEESFVLRLTSEFYPRFHLYVATTPEQISFDLHLDQKKASYGNNTQHSGEYTGPTVEKEMQRIHGWVKSMAQQVQRDTAEHDVLTRSQEQQKKFGGRITGWLRKLFGEYE